MLPVLVEQITKSFRISEKDLLGRSRRREFAYPRFVLVKALHQSGFDSLHGLGRMLDRDPKSIAYALAQADNLIPRYPALAAAYQKAMQAVA